MWKIPKQSYTDEFKLGAVKLVEGGQRPASVAKQLGVTEQTLSNWRKAAGKPITQEQMELSLLRAANTRLKMEMEILKKQPRTLRGSRCKVRLDRETTRLVYAGGTVRRPRGEPQRLCCLDARWRTPKASERYAVAHVHSCGAARIEGRLRFAAGVARAQGPWGCGEPRARGAPDAGERYPRQAQAPLQGHRGHLPVAPNLLDRNFAPDRPDEYIEAFDNRSCRHSELGYISPAQHYAAWHSQQKMAA